MSEAPGGLRERSKAKRHKAIQSAAFRLFAERGYDATTIADIAAAAEVSPRTVSMYFPSKVEIAVSNSDAIASRLVEMFEQRPDATFLEVIGAWLRREAELMDHEFASLALAMNEANPGLASLNSARMARAFEIGTQAMADEVGLPVDDPMFGVIGAAVGAAVPRYFTTVARDGPSERFHAQFMSVLTAIAHAQRPGRPPRAAGTARRRTSS